MATLDKIKIEPNITSGVLAELNPRNKTYYDDLRAQVQISVGDRNGYARVWYSNRENPNLAEAEIKCRFYNFDALQESVVIDDSKVKVLYLESLPRLIESEQKRKIDAAREEWMSSWIHTIRGAVAASGIKGLTCELCPSTEDDYVNNDPKEYKLGCNLIYRGEKKSVSMSQKSFGIRQYQVSFYEPRTPSYTKPESLLKYFVRKVDAKLQEAENKALAKIKNDNFIADTVEKYNKIFESIGCSCQYEQRTVYNEWARGSQPRYYHVDEFYIVLPERQTERGVLKRKYKISASSDGDMSFAGMGYLTIEDIKGILTILIGKID